MSFGPPKPVSSSEDRIGSDALTFSYTSSDRLVKHSQNSGHSSLEYPALSPFTPPCVSLASCGAEHRDPPQPLSVDAIATGFERDRPTNRGKGAPDGHLTIPANCRSPTSDKVHTEIPTINGAIILFFPEDPTSLMIPQECSEDIGDMPARSESSQGTDHSSSSLSAATASSPPPPSALKATSGRGVPGPCGLITVTSLTSYAMTQLLRRQNMRHSDGTC